MNGDDFDNTNSEKMLSTIDTRLWHVQLESVSACWTIGKYKLLCPRGTQTCALAVTNIKVNGNGKVILDTHPESDQHQN